MPSIAVSLILIAIAVTFLAVTPVVAQEAVVTVSVKAVEYVGEGETFVATIDVSSVSDLNSALFDLSFDPSVVEVTDVTDGRIDDTEIPIYYWDYIDSGTITVISGFPEKFDIMVSGSGYLAKITFEVIGEEGDECVLEISNGELVKIVKTAKGGDEAEEMPADWIDAEIKVGEEDSDEEPPDITTWEPAEVVVSSTEGESITFEITVDQTVDISWQINGTGVQTDESVTEAIYTNTSAAIGTWNLSAIAISTETGLSDIHTWIWSVTPTSTVSPEVTPGPTPTLAPGETPTPTPTLAPGVTPLREATPKEKTTPKPTALPTEEKPTPTPMPTPKEPGFEAIFAIAVMTLFLFYKKKTCAKRKKGDKRREE